MLTTETAAGGALGADSAAEAESVGVLRADKAAGGALGADGAADAGSVWVLRSDSTAGGGDSLGFREQLGIIKPL